MKVFEVSKQADGTYRWRGSPSNNVLDRDMETVSRQALEEVVLREKARSHYPPLQFYHIDYDIGTTDYYGMVDGILLATGEFNRDPVSKTIAQFYVDHPEGLDGSGWAMSWRYWSNPDADGTYQRIKGIKEFTFLPFSKAANQITEFSVEASKDMTWTEEQRKALDAVLDNPEMLAFVEQAQAAKKKSADLDAEGAQRKSAEGEASIEKAKPTVGDGKDEGDSDAADSAKCASCGHAMSKHGAAKASGAGKCGVDGCDCGGYKAKAFVAEDVSDKLAEDIARFVAEEVGKQVDALTNEVNKALTLLAETVQDLQAQQQNMEETEKAIADEYVSPQITGAYERLKAKAASVSEDTKIAKDNPLARGPQVIENAADDVFSRVGLA